MNGSNRPDKNGANIQVGRLIFGGIFRRDDLLADVDLRHRPGPNSNSKFDK